MGKIDMNKYLQKHGDIVMRNLDDRTTLTNTTDRPAKWIMEFGMFLQEQGVSKYYTLQAMDSLEISGPSDRGWTDIRMPEFIDAPGYEAERDNMSFRDAVSDLSSGFGMQR